MPVPALAPATRVVEDLRGVDLSVNLCRGLIDVPPGLRINDRAFQFSPSVPAQRGRGRVCDEEPLVLPRGHGQEVELGGPVEDGAH